LIEPDETLPSSPTDPGSGEAPGFAPESLVNCTKCSRGNSPLRTTCIYCGQQLPVSDRQVDLGEVTLRPPADWETGFNVIVTPSAPTQQQISSAGSLLRVTVEEIQPLLDPGLPVPVARTATQTEADLVAKRLNELGLGSRVVSDDDLNIEPAPPKPIRGMDFGDRGVSMMTSGSTAPIVLDWDQVELFVLGRFRERRTEMNERKGKRQEMELIDVRELSTDEPVLDLYTRGGWNGRMTANGFNFGCLGERKTFATGQNFALLVEELRRRAAGAVFDDTYRTARRALEFAWPMNQRNESLGWTRHGLGKVSTDAALVTDNVEQFTRYSRLRYLLHGTGQESSG
jgi:hypothetical protein